MTCPRCGGLCVMEESDDCGLRLRQMKCLICAFRSHGKLEGVAEETIAAGRHDPLKKKTNPYRRREA